MSNKLKCPKCGEDSFYVWGTATDFVEHASSFSEDGEDIIDLSESITDHCGATDWYGGVTCVGCDYRFDRFTKEELKALEDVYPYSVLLLYPDPTEQETYFAHVMAKDEGEALEKAQIEASVANDGLIKPDDFFPLIILQGHHEAEVTASDFI